MLRSAVEGQAGRRRKQFETAGFESHRRQVVRAAQLTYQPSGERPCAFRNELMHLRQERSARFEELSGSRVRLHDEHMRASWTEVVAVCVAGRFRMQDAAAIRERP